MRTEPISQAILNSIDYLLSDLEKAHQRAVRHSKGELPGGEVPYIPGRPLENIREKISYITDTRDYIKSCIEQLSEKAELEAADKAAAHLKIPAKTARKNAEAASDALKNAEADVAEKWATVRELELVPWRALVEEILESRHAATNMPALTALLVASQHATPASPRAETPTAAAGSVSDPAAILAAANERRLEEAKADKAAAQAELDQAAALRSAQQAFERAKTARDNAHAKLDQAVAAQDATELSVEIASLWAVKYEIEKINAGVADRKRIAAAQQEAERRAALPQNEQRLLAANDHYASALNNLKAVKGKIAYDVWEKVYAIIVAAEEIRKHRNLPVEERQLLTRVLKQTHANLISEPEKVYSQERELVGLPAYADLRDKVAVWFGARSIWRVMLDAMRDFFAIFRDFPENHKHEPKLHEAMGLFSKRVRSVPAPVPQPVLMEKALLAAESPVAATVVTPDEEVSQLLAGSPSGPAQVLPKPSRLAQPNSDSSIEEGSIGHSPSPSSTLPGGDFGEGVVDQDRNCHELWRPIQKEKQRAGTPPHPLPGPQAAACCV